eukprot:954939-Prorocentrum_minimum.AAC.1
MFISMTAESAAAESPPTYGTSTGLGHSPSSTRERTDEQSCVSVVGRLRSGRGAGGGDNNNNNNNNMYT